MLGLVSAKSEGGGAHQLEPDEEIEEIAGEAKGAHGAEKSHHQDVVQIADRIEIAQRKDERHGHQSSGKGGQASAKGIDHKRNADGGAGAWHPSAEPIDNGLRA